MYSFNSRIRFSETDKTGHLNMSSVIDYFQDCSMFHAEEAGLGLSYYRQHQKTWVLSSWQLEARRFPKVYEKVTISTYPYMIKGFMGYRNFTMKDENGEICVIADSSWVYMNMKENKPARATSEDTDAFGIDPKLDMDYKKGKILLPAEMDKPEPFPVLPSYIDSNQHVNNGQYVQLATNYLPEGFHPAKLRVEYRSAARIGDVIYPMIHTSQTVCIISLNNAEGKPYAIMEFVS